MASRERILAALRHTAGELPPPLQQPTDAGLFADYADNPATCLRLFRERFTALHGEYHEARSVEAAAAIVGKLLEGLAPNKFLVTDHPDLRSVLGLLPALGMGYRRTRFIAMPSREMAEYEVGITSATCLVARTGSILLTTHDGGGRRLSVLPPTHVVVARPSLLVPSLEEAIALLGARGEAWTSAALITGPSRTADIEKVLVLGAHGPKRLVVVMLDEAEWSKHKPLPE